MKQWMKMLQNEAFLCMTHKCPDLFIPTSPPLKSFKMAGSWFDQPPQPWRLGAASASQFKWLGLTWKVIFTHPETSLDQGTIQTLTILQFTVYTMFTQFTQLMPDPSLAVLYIFNLNVSAELKFKLWSLDTGLAWPIQRFSQMNVEGACALLTHRARSDVPGDAIAFENLQILLHSSRAFCQARLRRALATSGVKM